MGKKTAGYIGTYTETTKRTGSKGIYAVTLDLEDGRIEDIHLAAESRNPSYLTIRAVENVVPAVNELDEAKENGRVSAFRRDFQSGNLELLNQVSSVGKAFQVIQFSGTGPNVERQEGPHAHFFLFNKTYDRGFAFDLGTDRLIAYTFDSGAAEPLKPAVSPSGDINSITVFKRDTVRGLLSFVESVPSGGRTPRDFAVDPSGNYLLVCHQDSDNLVVFRIDRDSGKFTQVGEYPIPAPVCVIF